jgi:hypothetical protein
MPDWYLFTYTPFATDTVTAPTLATAAAPLSLVDFTSDGGAGSIKNAYVNFLTNGTRTDSIVWFWEEGKPKLFRLDNDK